MSETCTCGAEYHRAPERCPVLSPPGHEPDTVAEEQLEALRRENAELRRIVDDTLWMARRCAHGRQSYAPAMLAHAIASAERLGITMDPDRALNPPNPTPPHTDSAVGPEAEEDSDA